MRTIGVDPAFSDSKTRKNTIKREMVIEVLSDGTAYLQVTLRTGRENAQQLRTCVSSFLTNLQLVCQTMSVF